MARVAKKMGIGDRGALVPGTGLQALDMLSKLGSDPSFWSDGEEEEDDDAYLDELQAHLLRRHVVHPACRAHFHSHCTRTALALHSRFIRCTRFTRCTCRCRVP